MDSSENEPESASDNDEYKTNDEPEKDKIRQEISNMSFEELIKLKEKMGSKLYNATITGQATNKKPPRTFKRANKNRPREMSSKRPVKIEKTVIPVKTNTPRDPRFDPLCGTFDNKTFRENYGFLKDVKKKEIKELENEYKKVDDEARKRKIKFLLERMKNQVREQEKLEKQDREKMAELSDIKEKLRHGQKPTFKKKSEKKIEELVHKYEDLKKDNRLEKHIKKRSKKIASREFKNMNK